MQSTEPGSALLQERVLAIVVPALDEEATIGGVLAALPRSLASVDRVVTIVVDDGSSDRTAEVAAAHGAVVVRHRTNRGLGRAYTTGITAALRAGATRIVQIDADGQYDPAEIPALLGPIEEGRADLVVGARPIDRIGHFSPAKRWFQRFGSWVVRVASGTSVPDAPSGFRAMSREAARRLHVLGSYTYTLETLIQAGRIGLRVTSVPIRVNGPTRPSRLMRGWVSYVRRSAVTIVRVAVAYRPFRSFALVGSVLLLAGVGLVGRYLILRVLDAGDQHLPSLIVAGALVTVAIQLFAVAFVADAVAMNRRLVQRLIEMRLDEDRG